MKTSGGLGEFPDVDPIKMLLYTCIRVAVKNLALLSSSSPSFR